MREAYALEDFEWENLQMLALEVGPASMPPDCSVCRPPSVLTARFRVAPLTTRFYNVLYSARTIINLSPSLPTPLSPPPLSPPINACA